MTYEVQNRSLPSSFWVYTHGKHLAISMCFIFTDSTYSCHPQATKFISLKSMRVQGSKLKARRWPNLELDDCCTKRDLWWLHVTMKTVLDGFTRRVVESDGSDAEVVLALDPVWSRRSSADIAAPEDAAIAGAGLGCDRHGACDVALDTILDGAAEAVLARGPVAPTPQSRA